MKNEMAWMEKCSGSKTTSRVQCFICKRGYCASCLDWNRRASEYLQSVANDRNGLRWELRREFCVGSNTPVRQHKLQVMGGATGLC